MLLASSKIFVIIIFFYSLYNSCPRLFEIILDNTQWQMHFLQHYFSFNHFFLCVRKHISNILLPAVLLVSFRHVMNVSNIFRWAEDTLRHSAEAVLPCDALVVQGAIDRVLHQTPQKTSFVILIDEIKRKVNDCNS